MEQTQGRRGYLGELQGSLLGQGNETDGWLGAATSSDKGGVGKDARRGKALERVKKAQQRRRAENWAWDEMEERLDGLGPGWTGVDRGLMRSVSLVNAPLFTLCPLWVGGARMGGSPATACDTEQRKTANHSLT